MKLANRSSLSTKLTVYFLIAALLPVGIAGVLILRVAQKNIDTLTFSNLELARNLKINQINLLIEKESEVVNALSKTQTVQDSAMSLKNKQPLSPAQLSAYKPLVEVEGEFIEVFLIDSETAKVYASSNTAELTKNKQLDESFVRGKQALFVQDLYFDYSNFVPRYTITTPIIIGGQLVGVFGAHLELDAIDQIMAEPLGIGDTSETYLINKAHQFVSDSRFDPNSKFNLGLNTAQSESVLAGKEGKGIYKNYRGKLVYGNYVYIPERHLAIFAEVEQHEALASLREFERLILYAALASCLFLVLLTRLFTNQFLKPIRKLTEGVEAFGRGQLTTRISITSKDEVRKLAETFNSMAQSVQDSITKLRELDKLKSEFLAIASHNLRTPLSVIMGYADGMRDANNKLNKDAAIIGSYAQRLNVFAEDMLLISEIEIGGNLATVTQKTPTDITTLIGEIATQITPMVSEKKLSLGVVAAKKIPMVNINKQYVKDAIWNILDNAIKFTGENGIITMTAKPVKDKVTVTIADTGAGIAKEELPMLFTKFHRGTSTMVYNYEGTGLGLYVAKLIVESNGGQIEVESVEGKGTTVTLMFPVAPVEPKSKDALTPKAVKTIADTLE